MPRMSNVMLNESTLLRDRQLLLIFAVWAYVILSSLKGGFSLPTSKLAAEWPFGSGIGSFVFALVGPAVGVLLSRFLHLGRGSVLVEWPLRLIYRVFGAESAQRFWRRLRPLLLFGTAALVQGCTGYFVAVGGVATNRVVMFSVMLICVGVGCFAAALLERFVLNASKSA
jgi:hypothetical protein